MNLAPALKELSPSRSSLVIVLAIVQSSRPSGSQQSFPSCIPRIHSTAHLQASHDDPPADSCFLQGRGLPLR